MQNEEWENLTTEIPMKAKHIQEMWNYWRKRRPDYIQFLKYTVPAVMHFSGNFAVFPASELAVTLWEKFQETDEASEVHSSELAVTLWEKFQETDEASEVHSAFSNLSLMSDFGRTAEHLILSACLSSSNTGGSGPPLIFKDKGVDALQCAVNDGHYPPPADDATTESLFPKDEWNTVLHDAERKSEAKLTSMFEKQTEEALKRAKAVFVKPKKALFSYKIADFLLVDKEFQEAPTADTVGALLFAQFTFENSKSYSFEAAVGEAVAVAQMLLRNASQQRQFVIIGVTDFRRIRWFRVERPTMGGRFKGSRCWEIASVRESLAGMMTCPLENLGICKRSIVEGEQQYYVSRWLGEGATSNVYAINVNDVECAVKVAKPGHSVSMDVRNLQKLQGIKGIPTIVKNDSPSVMLITPVAEQFSLELLCRKKMHKCLGELVDTLHWAHSRGMVNRDIRMGNILIAEDQLIIVDWGFATSSNEPDRYAGTLHFASTRVLKMLEEGQHIFSVEPSDDLVSLVRSLYVISRVDIMRVHNALTNFSNDDFAQIQEFWETEIKKSSQWEEAEMYAKQSDYAALTRWIQNWSRMVM